MTQGEGEREREPNHSQSATTPANLAHKGWEEGHLPAGLTHLVAILALNALTDNGIPQLTRFSPPS